MCRSTILSQVSLDSSLALPMVERFLVDLVCGQVCFGQVTNSKRPNSALSLSLYWRGASTALQCPGDKNLCSLQASFWLALLSSQGNYGHYESSNIMFRRSRPTTPFFKS
ncbi:hypothetical protein GOODEAATRI_013840 [Goodea atripinnis]|uniref:Uncharacterized protein n=1 Tax=Goodea atripinnis TaxID=208336 RepID=A0ABV0MRV2_9TELE